MHAPMKNITVAVHEDLFRNARICAAQRGTTVTELIRNFLSTLRTSPENVPGSRVPTSQDRISADKCDLMMHKILERLREEDEANGENTYPPPSPL